MADHAARNDGNASDPFPLADFYSPSYFWRVFWNAAVHFVFEVGHDFGTAQLPPHFRRRDFLSVFQSERIGIIRPGISFGLIVVCVVRVAFVSTRPGPN